MSVGAVGIFFGFFVLPPLALLLGIILFAIGLAWMGWALWSGKDNMESQSLVLIHASLATGAGNWKAYVPYLSTHFRLIMPGQRGHGKTNNPQGEIRLPTLTDDLVAFIKALNLEKLFLCGWSGGAILPWT